MIVYAVIEEVLKITDNIYSTEDDYEETTDCEYNEYLHRIFLDFKSAKEYIQLNSIDNSSQYRIDTYDTITGISTGAHYIDGYSNFDEI